MEDKIIKFLSKLITTQHLNEAKEQTTSWYSSIQSTLNPNEKETFLLIFTKSLRFLYQNELNKLLLKGRLKDFGTFITSYSLWLNREGVIDFIASLTLLEDIIETYPIDGIEGIYSIMEDFLKSKTQTEIDQRSITILKITNIMLKRLSSSLDTKLRGRVQMMLSTIFRLSEKSGVNLKGLYNVNNSSSWNNIQSNAKIANVQFYKQFWLLHRYLTNPILLFPAYAQQDNSNEVIELLQEEQMFSNENRNKSETISMMEVDSGLNKVDVFLSNIRRILVYFQSNPIDIIKNNRVTHSLLSYPKYLTHPELFDLQLNDPEFRKTLLIQFAICLKAFLRPVSQLQKNCFVFTEEMIGKINETLKLCFGILAQYGSEISSVFENETHWERWKEGSCQKYEKNCTEDIKKEIDKYREETQEARPSLFQSKIRIENRGMNSYDFSKEFGVRIKDIQNINVQIEVDTINSEVPYIGTFIERVFSEEDPVSEIESKERTIEKDSSFSWKFLKLLAENDINKIISGKSNVMSICQEIHDKFKSKNSTFVFPSSHQPPQDKVTASPKVTQAPTVSPPTLHAQKPQAPPQQSPQQPQQVINEINLNALNNINHSSSVPKPSGIPDAKVGSTKPPSEGEISKEETKEEEKKEVSKDKVAKTTEKDPDSNDRKGRSDKDYLLHRKRNNDHSYDKIISSNNNKKHKSN